MTERFTRWARPTDREVQGRVTKPTAPAPKIERPDLPVRLPAGPRR